jgi:hypothetical protein
MQFLMVGAYDVRIRVCFAITAKPRNILPIASFLDLFEGRSSIASIKRSYHRNVVFSNVGY